MPTTSRRARPLAVALTASAGLLAVAAAPSIAAIPSFCGGVPASKVTSIVGGKLTLAGSTTGKTTICTYLHVGNQTNLNGEVIIGREAGLLNGISGNLAKERQVLSTVFKASHGVAKISALPALGRGAFVFTLKISRIVINGIEVFKGNIAYSVESYGSLALAKQEQLVKLAVAAG